MLETGEIYVQHLTETGTKDTALLPQWFLDALPKNCPECGSPTLITSALTRLYCPSEDCGGKVAKRLLALTKDLGVKEFGEKTIRKFLTKFNLKNPYYIFAYNPIDGDGTITDEASMETSVKIYNQFQQRKAMQLWEYVKVGNLKGLRDRALPIFGEYDDLAKFYEDFEQGGVGFIQSKLDIEASNTSGVSVVAVELTNTLTHNKASLFACLDYVDIIKNETTQTIIAEDGTEQQVASEKKVFNICMSTAIGNPYTSKEHFAHTVKTRFSDHCVINVIGGVSEICDVLIWAGGAETTKVTNARKKNAKRQKLRDAGQEAPPDIMILSGLQFEQYLEQLTTIQH